MITASTSHHHQHFMDLKVYCLLQEAMTGHRTSDVTSQDWSKHPHADTMCISLQLTSHTHTQAGALAVSQYGQSAVAEAVLSSQTRAALFASHALLVTQMTTTAMVTTTCRLYLASEHDCYGDHNSTIAPLQSNARFRLRSTDEDCSKRANAITTPGNDSSARQLQLSTSLLLITLQCRAAAAVSSVMVLWAMSGHGVCRLWSQTQALGPPTSSGSDVAPSA